MRAKCYGESLSERDSTVVRLVLSRTDLRERERERERENSRWFGDWRVFEGREGR